ncbi:MAG: hypothetical protein WCF57_04800 [Pyrinomonadaceae bacterium]
MRTIEIRKLAARYRLPRSADDERRRLDRALRAAMSDGTFEEALVREGVPLEGELCIQNIYATAHLRLSGTDRSLALAWSAAMARTIKRAIYGGHVSGVAHYSSRVQALVDMAVGVSLGDTRRAWAWRQLGLWRGGQSVNDAGRVGTREATSELVRAFEQEPALIVPTLRALARGRLLERLAARLSREQWTVVANSALAGVNTSLRVDRMDARGVPAAPDVSHQARRLSGVSTLFHALAAQAPVAATVARAMAILTILEVSPAALGAGEESSEALAVEVARLLASTRAQAEPEANAGEMARSIQPGQELEVEQEGQEAVEAGERADGDERALPVVRQYALTRFGGLLFLLGVVEDLGLPQLMMTDAALRARPFRWMMQRLALVLIPAVEASDPAVMAFAGLAPDAPSPAEQEEAATVLEEGAINAFALMIVENLRERLEPLDEPQTDVMKFVCVRRAELVVDPGWIEVHLSLDDVSTKIRRAGLDLDPGYVPWLGVVVKFIYE